MNIFNKVALQSLKKNRTRTMITVVGVALSAALVTAVATFAVSLQNYLINGAAVKYGSWHVEIPDADPSILSDQAADKRVTDTVALQNIGYAMLEGSQNPDKPYLFITGWNQKALDTLPISLLSGRLPENNSEILIPAHIAANGGVKISVGDTLTLMCGERISQDQKLNQHDPYRNGEEALAAVSEKVYTVTGICQRPTIEEFTAPGYTLITTAEEAPADSLTVFITLANPYQVHSYASTIAEGYSYVLNNEVLRFMGLSGEKLLMVLLYCVGGILTALVMLGSVFLIYNSFNISLNARTQEYGILLSVGATEKQLRNSVLFEGLCIGAIGIPLGVLLGIPSIMLVLTLVSKNFANIMYDNVALTLKVSAPAIVAAVAVSMITIIISAYIPARKASRTPVMECIRQTNEIRVDAKAVKTSRLTEYLYGLEGTLASKNFKRNKQRYRSIILSLTLSVVLTVLADSFGAYLNQLAVSTSEAVEDYDICFYTRDMEEAELFQLYDSLKTADGVYESSVQALSTYSCVLRTSELPLHFLDEYGGPLGYDRESETVEAQLDIQFVEEGVYQSLLERVGLSPEEYTGQDNQMIMAAFLPSKWYTQEQPMEFTLTSGTGDKTKTIRVTFIKDYPDLLPGEVGEYPGYTLMAIAPYEVKPQFDALDATVIPSKLGMTFKSEQPGRSTSQMKTMIECSCAVK